MRCDRIWRNARLATMTSGREPLGLIDAGLLACRDGRIVYAGAADEAPRDLSGDEVDCLGRLITPGFIDCHTHLVHGGDRSREFEQRLNGISYEAIARQGGGIMSTVKETRLATDEQLLAESLPRLAALIDEGVTTVEIKSGYGLEVAKTADVLDGQPGVPLAVRGHDEPRSRRMRAFLPRVLPATRACRSPNGSRVARPN